MWENCTCELLFTGCNEVVAKVMFLHVCVILFTGGFSGQTPRDQADTPRPARHPPGPGRPPWDQADTPLGPDRPPPREQTPAYGLRAAGTHPTGKHSCLRFTFNKVDYKSEEVSGLKVLSCHTSRQDVSRCRTRDESAGCALA